MKLNRVEKKTFRLMFLATIMNGLVMSVAQTQDIIGKKALMGLDWHITILAMAWPVSNFFSIYWGKILENSPNKPKYFWWVAIGGRLVLLFSAVISNINYFIIMLFVMFSFNGLYLPLQNNVLQSNIRRKYRGNFFGYLASGAGVITIIVTFTAGKILDYDDNLFRPMYFIIGVITFMGTALLTRIKIERKPNEQDLKPKNKQTAKEIILAPLKRSIELCRKNKSFAYFELSFFMYGLGFIMMLVVIPKYLVVDLQLTYSTAFLAKTIIAQAFILALSPLFGKLHDKKNPFTFSAIFFLLLSFYPMTLFVSTFVGNDVVVYFVYAAFVFFGIAMTGVNISWSIGTIHFAGEEDASMYQSVHVSLTGLRGIVAPMIGFVILKLFSIRYVFLLAALFQITAALMNFYRCKHTKNLCKDIS